MTTLVVEVYSRKTCNSVCKLFRQDGKCTLCAEAKEVISRVNSDIPFQFKEVDIEISDEFLRAYSDSIPTVFINGKKAFKFRVDEAEFRKKLRKEWIKAGLMRLGKKPPSTPSKGHGS